MKREHILDVICILFIILFTYAAVNKLLDIEKFTLHISRSPLLTSIAGFIAWFIPAIEIAITLLLVSRRYRIIGLYASFTLMIMFTGYIIAITQFSEDIPCSCGGVLENMGWTEHLFFNIGFVLLGLVGVVLSPKTEKASLSGVIN